MRRFSTFVCVLVFSIAQAAAQQNARVVLGSNVALLGETVRILVELEAGGESVSRIEGEVSFPSFLSFLSMEAGTAVGSNPVALKADLLPEKSAEDLSQLKATIGAGDGSLLPDGIVAVLTFRAATDLEEEVEGPLTGNLSLTGPGGEKIPADTVPALITVMKSEPPLPACFFYMH